MVFGGGAAKYVALQRQRVLVPVQMVARPLQLHSVAGASGGQLAPTPKHIDFKPGVHLKAGSLPAMVPAATTEGSPLAYDAPSRNDATHVGDIIIGPGSVRGWNQRNPGMLV